MASIYKNTTYSYLNKFLDRSTSFIKYLVFWNWQSGWTKGKISCPSASCSARIGSFDFCSGIKCRCFEFVLPPIRLVASKVDVINRSVNTQTIVRWERTLFHSCSAFSVVSSPMFFFFRLTLPSFTKLSQFPLCHTRFLASEWWTRRVFVDFTEFYSVLFATFTFYFCLSLVLLDISPFY